jgi:hypothetical protein
MQFGLTRLSLAAAVMAAGSLLQTAQAQITGSMWEGQNPAGGATLANVPGSAADVTFSVPNGPLSFDSRSGGNNSANYTIGSWLGTGGATILTGLGEAGHTLDNTLTYLTGTVSVLNGQTFTVVHDDGLTLIIGGQMVINDPGPTPPATTTGTYTGVSGNEPFQLVYGENSGPPGVLDVNLPLQGVPDSGSTLMLLGAAFSGLAAFRRRLACA